MWKFLALLTLAAVTAHGAPKDVYPAQHFSVKGVRDIKIVGVRGSLKLRGRAAKFMTLKVQHTANRKAADDWNLSLDRRGGTLFIEVANVTYGKQWRSHIKEELWPEFDIELSGPAKPTVISWREGNLEFVDWNADLEASYLKGKARVRGGKGRLKIQQGTADLEIRNWRGPVDASGESGRANLVAVAGPIDLNWLRGTISLVRCTGILQIEATESDLRIEGGSGQLMVEMPKGRAHIENFAGVVKANGAESNWKIGADAPSDLNVTTLTGEVQLTWTGGAKVFLTSTVGQIHGPQSLISAKREGRKVVEGTLKGRGKGQVFVRTSSGAILLR